MESRREEKKICRGLDKKRRGGMEGRGGVRGGRGGGGLVKILSEMAGIALDSKEVG